jgi:hypothetical protein
MSFRSRTSEAWRPTSRRRPGRRNGRDSRRASPARQRAGANRLCHQGARTLRGTDGHRLAPSIACYYESDRSAESSTGDCARRSFCNREIDLAPTVRHMQTTAPRKAGVSRTASREVGVAAGPAANRQRLSATSSGRGLLCRSDVRSFHSSRRYLGEQQRVVWRTLRLKPIPSWRRRPARSPMNTLV